LEDIDRGKLRGIETIISTDQLELLVLSYSIYNAEIHFTIIHNTERQFCYSIPAFRPASHLRCGHMEGKGKISK